MTNCKEFWCVLQNDTPSPEHCKSICDQICYGFYEEGEEKS